MKSKGMFITLEGIDGCGKSTQSRRLADWLTERTNTPTIRTFEPGGCEECVTLREFILSRHDYAPMTELLLFLADRAEHVNRVITPELAQGHNVICERWNESTLAYQSGGHNLYAETVKALIASCNFPKPDVKILLSVTPETAITRITSRGKSDRFEDEGLVLMRKVCGAYERLADMGELVRVDCSSLNESQVFDAITREIGGILWRSR